MFSVRQNCQEENDPEAQRIFLKVKRKSIDVFLSLLLERTNNRLEQFPIKAVFKFIKDLMILIEDRLILIVFQMKPFDIGVGQNQSERNFENVLKNENDDRKIERSSCSKRRNERSNEFDRC